MKQKLCRNTKPIIVLTKPSDHAWSHSNDIVTDHYDCVPAAYAHLLRATTVGDE